MSNDILPDLVDWANQVDPDGAIAELAWLLAQSNGVLKDMMWDEGNLPNGHVVSALIGLPQGTYRAYNQGVASSKAAFAQYQFALGNLTDYSKVDKDMAMLGGNVKQFRFNQDQTHVMGLSQQVARDIFYASEAISPNSFTGFFAYYNALTPANGAQTSQNVISAGGTGTSNASIFLAGWGRQSAFCFYPKGSKAGLAWEDKGDIVPLTDQYGNRFEGYTTYLNWKLGLAIANWQYNVRIPNIDTTINGIFGSSAPDLFALMSDAATHLPEWTLNTSGITDTDSPVSNMGLRPAWYCNRTVRSALDRQAMRDKNVLLTIDDFAGKPTIGWRSIPIRVCDGLLNTESTIS
jgi:hypothetical protein